jgi:hypothetical protein
MIRAAQERAIRNRYKEVAPVLEQGRRRALRLPKRWRLVVAA